MVGGLRDVITCAEFKIEIFMGYDYTGGRIFDFPIDFSMGLTTVQRYNCAACEMQSGKVLLSRRSIIHGVTMKSGFEPEQTDRRTYILRAHSPHLCRASHRKYDMIFHLISYLIIILKTN